MTKPYVTFYMQAYNAEKYIEKSINSILTQSVSNIELMLYDNASTDNTGEICRRFAKEDNRIIFRKNEKNTVLNPEYAQEWIHPNGEYYAYLDADDYLDKDFVKIMYRAAENNKADMVICGTEMFLNENPHSVSTRIPIELSTKDINEIVEKFIDLYGSFRPLWAKLYRTDFYLEHAPFAFDRPQWLLSGSDTFAVLRYLRKCQSFVSIDKALHHYRIHESSIYNSNVTLNRVLECDCLYNEGIELLKEWNALDKERVDFLLNVHFGSISDCLKNAAHNEKACLYDRLNMIQSIVTNDIFCNYALASQNQKKVGTIVEESAKMVSRKTTAMDISKLGNFFVDRIYRAMEKNVSHEISNWMALLLSAICDTENKYHWGINYLIEYSSAMPLGLKKVLKRNSGCLVSLLKRPDILREIVNEDFERIAVEQKLSDSIKKVIETLPKIQTDKDKNKVNELKIKLNNFVSEGNFEDAVPIMVHILQNSILDREGLYFKMYISWQIGEKEIAVETAEVARVFWNDDPDILAICGDIFEAIGAFKRAKYCYQRAISNSNDEMFSADINKRISQMI